MIYKLDCFSYIGNTSDFKIILEQKQIGEF